MNKIVPPLTDTPKCGTHPARPGPTPSFPSRMRSTLPHDRPALYGSSIGLPDHEISQNKKLMSPRPRQCLLGSNWKISVSLFRGGVRFGRQAWPRARARACRDARAGCRWVGAMPPRAAEARARGLPMGGRNAAGGCRGARARCRRGLPRHAHEVPQRAAEGRARDAVEWCRGVRAGLAKDAPSVRGCAGDAVE